MKAYTAISSAVLLTLIAARAHADDFDDRASKLVFGLRANAVLALMGRSPDASRTTTTVFGIPETKWRWSGSNGRFVSVVMIQNRLIYTSVCAGVAPSDC